MSISVILHTLYVLVGMWWSPVLQSSLEQQVPYAFVCKPSAACPMDSYLTLVEWGARALPSWCHDNENTMNHLHLTAWQPLDFWCTKVVALSIGDHEQGIQYNGFPVFVPPTNTKVYLHCVIFQPYGKLTFYKIMKTNQSCRCSYPQHLSSHRSHRWFKKP